MSDIPSFPYELLWEERVRALGREPHAPRRRGVPARSRRGCRCETHVTTYPLEGANEALADLRAGRFSGRGGARALDAG